MSSTTANETQNNGSLAVELSHFREPTGLERPRRVQVYVEVCLLDHFLCVVVDFRCYTDPGLKKKVTVCRRGQGICPKIHQFSNNPFLVYDPQAITVPKKRRLRSSILLTTATQEQMKMEDAEDVKVTIKNEEYENFKASYLQLILVWGYVDAYYHH